MRQKYQIIQDTTKNKLKIREYAILDKNLHKTKTSMLSHADYCLLYEEMYDSAEILSSISKGRNQLVETLRTPDMFPIAPTADRIAEAVESLYASAKDASVELFFNDIE